MEKICLEGDFGAPEPGKFTKILNFQFCFILLSFFSDFGVFEVLAFCVFYDFIQVLLIFGECDFRPGKS